MNYQNSKILVTGGAGFIGVYLIKRLLSLGASVTVVDASRGNLPLSSDNRINFIKLRLPSSRFSDVIAQEKFDGVFHLAGMAYVPPSLKDPIGDLRSNAEVTLQVLEAVRHHAPETRLIYTSSAAVYGNPVKLPISENDPLAPVSPYGVSKLAAENYVSLYARLYGLRTAALRLFSVFGPGQRKQVIFDILAKLHANPKKLEVHGSGEEMRDFIYVDDVVNATQLVMAQGNLKGEAYNIASGIGTTIRELVDITLSVTGLKPQIQFTGQERPGDALKWIADISKLKSLGFTQSVKLREGIHKIVEWQIRDEQEGR